MVARTASDSCNALAPGSWNTGIATAGPPSSMLRNA